mgnify:CR=1 FL=1
MYSLIEFTVLIQAAVGQKQCELLVGQFTELVIDSADEVLLVLVVVDIDVGVGH